MLKSKLPADEALLFAGYPGDPYDNASWRMHVYNENTKFFPSHNIYVCVMSSRQNDRGEFRRKKENFGHGLFLMIDDLGDGKGSKNPISILEKLSPTMLVETSPRNFQAIYVFKEPIKDMGLFEGLINGFITKQFIDGKDPGMRGVNRVARLPFGINGKKKYMNDGEPWEVRATEWRPEHLYDPKTIIEAFDIQIVQRKPWAGTRLIPDDYRNRIDIFKSVYVWLEKHHMLKKVVPDLGGKIPMTCPWVDQHSDGADSGTYLAVPSEENGFCGSFVCYHSSTHNDQTGWGKLLRWILDNSTEIRSVIEEQEKGIEQALNEANEMEIRG